MWIYWVFFSGLMSVSAAVSMLSQVCVFCLQDEVSKLYMQQCTEQSKAKLEVSVDLCCGYTGLAICVCVCACVCMCVCVRACVYMCV